MRATRNTCPTCAARPGQKCHTLSGKKRRWWIRTTHHARYAARIKWT